MEHVKNLLSEYLDRELPESERRRAELHLDECPECRAGLDELRSVSRLVREMPREPLPAGFLQRLRARRNPPEPKPGYFLLPMPARAVAFALSSLIVMFVVYDKLKVMFPISSGIQGGISGAAGDLGKDLGLEPPQFKTAAPAVGFEQKAASPKRKELARAKGEPLFGALASGSDGSGSGLSRMPAPASARRASENEEGYTNEKLQKAIEMEKARMGIRRIVPLERRRFLVEDLAAARGARENLDAQMLVKAAPEAMIAGNTPAMLSTAELPPSAGIPIAEQAAPEDSMIKMEAAGGVAIVLVRSEAERSELWRRRGMRLSPPYVDYARQMLLILFAEGYSTVEIAEVKPLPDKILVRFRQSPLPPAEGERKPSAPPYQFRGIPKTDLPVVLEKLP